MRKHSKHECHEISEDCNQPLHLYGGVGKNYIFAFHFENESELLSFLNRNDWNSEQISQLKNRGEVLDGNEWARLVRQQLLSLAE